MIRVTEKANKATSAELRAAEALADHIRETIINRDPALWSAVIKEQIAGLRLFGARARLLEAPQSSVDEQMAARLRVPELTRHIPKDNHVELVMLEACKLVRDDLRSLISASSENKPQVLATMPARPIRTVFPFPTGLLATSLSQLPMVGGGAKIGALEGLSGYRVIDLMQFDRQEEWSAPGEQKVIPVIAEALERLHRALPVLFATTKELSLPRKVCKALRGVKVPVCDVRDGELCMAGGADRVPVLNGWGLFLMNREQVNKCINPTDRAILAGKFTEVGFRPKA